MPPCSCDDGAGVPDLREDETGFQGDDEKYERARHAGLATGRCNRYGVREISDMSTTRRAFGVVAVTCLGVLLILATLAGVQVVTVADVAVQHWIQSEAFRPLEPLMQGLSTLGSGYCLVPMAVIACLLVRPIHPPLAVAVPALFAGAAIVQAASKWAIARPRPSLAAYGFPSGHVFVSVAFFGAIVYVLWILETNAGWRWTGTGFCVAAVLSISLSRLYLNSHWLTDVLGALTGGASYLLFVLALFDRQLRPTRARPPRDDAGQAMRHPSRSD